MRTKEEYTMRTKNTRENNTMRIQKRIRRQIPQTQQERERDETKLLLHQNFTTPLEISRLITEMNTIFMMEMIKRNIYYGDNCFSCCCISRIDKELGDIFVLNLLLQRSMLHLHYGDKLTTSS